MIPVVDITYFIKVAVRTVFATVFSKTAAIVFIGVLISAFLEIGFFSLLDTILDKINFTLSEGGTFESLITESSVWAFCFDWFNLDYLFWGLFILLSLALQLLVLIPAFIGLIFGGTFAYGGVAAIRRLIAHMIDTGSTYKDSM